MRFKQKLFYIIATFLAWNGEISASPKDLTLLSRRTFSETLDLGVPGPSIGDISVNSGDILSNKTGAVLGTYVARKMIVSTETSAGTDERDTMIEYRLDNGSIVTQGVSVNSSNTTLIIDPAQRAVIGGTGYYAGAKGVITVTPVAGQPDVLHLAFRFR